MRLYLIIISPDRIQTACVMLEKKKQRDILKIANEPFKYQQKKLVVPIAPGLLLTKKKKEKKYSVCRAQSSSNLCQNFHFV